jgi:hypothetical protein
MLLLPRNSFLLVLLVATVSQSWSWSTTKLNVQRPTRLQQSSTASSADTTLERVDRLKSDLVKACQVSTKNKEDVRRLVRELEQTAEQAGVGQASSSSGLLSGEWELLYSCDETTRSSPFFWAFRRAFPDSADQIFGITDSIPAPLKEVGPAFQVVDWNDATQTGRFVSRVKVATLGGVATSIMTTRAAIVGADGLDGVKLKIETTKPEKSTVLAMLGPLGDALNENTPAFPSREAFERVRPGSSEVILRTSFCDEGLRISHDDERPEDILVWRRRAFTDYDFL